MRRLPFLAASVVGLAAAAAPAAAQIAGKNDYGHVPTASPFLPDSSLAGPGAGREVRDLRGRIDAARDAGVITSREARALDREARDLGRLGRRYSRDGLSPGERRELDARVLALRTRLAAR